VRVNAADAARRWAAVWAQAWPAMDVEAIVALYADGVRYRARAFREPDRGTAGVRAYLEQNFAVEGGIVCQFGEPVAAGDRAAVEWWASWEEDGHELTMAGVSLLRFDESGLVTDHRDYWNQDDDRRAAPYPGW
jgi:ketosteroid isomerase-like protein